MPLLGTWELLSWYNLEPNGQKHIPLGKDVEGYISYSTDGFVFVHISAARREQFELNDPFGGSMHEDSSAMKSHITYAGRYIYKSGEVVHNVVHSSCPNWVGSQQFRMVKLDGDQLQLSATGALFQGKTITAVLDWKRAQLLA